MHKYTIYLVIFLVSLFGHASSQQELEAVQWISCYYGIGWPNVDPCTIASNATYMINCVNGHVQEIQISLQNPVRNYGPPSPSVTYLDLPYLTYFKVLGLDRYLPYPSNILDKMVQLTNLTELILMQHRHIKSVPDLLLQNNPNLINIDLTATYELTYINCQLIPNIHKLSLAGTFLQANTFGSITYPQLTSMVISYANTVTVNITETQFPLLTDLSLYSFNNSVIRYYNMTLNIDSTKINLLSFLTAFYSFVLNMNCPNSQSLMLATHPIDYHEVVFIQPLEVSLPKVQALTLQGISQNFTDFTGFPDLVNLLFAQTVITEFPKLTPNVKSISLTGNDYITQFPTPFYYDQPYYTMDFTSISRLTGKVPDVMCRASTFHLEQTNITDIPDCMKCFYSQISSFLPPQIPVPTPVCNLTLTQSHYFSVDGTITITGNGMGWGLNNSDMSPNLSMVEANTKFYYLPQSYQNQTTVYFSYLNNLYVNISWEIVQIVLYAPIATRIPNGMVKITSFITYNPNYYHYALVATNNYTVTFYNENGNDYVEAIVPDSVLEIGLNYFTVANVFTNTSQQMSYLPTFPVVMNVGGNQTVGESIFIEGEFSTDYWNTSKVYLNDIYQCVVESLVKGNISCKVPSTIPHGTTKLVVDVAGFNSTASYILLQPPSSSPPPTCEQYNYCSNHGICNSLGSCVCYANYSGESCQYQINNNTVFQPNNTDTVASFQANGYQFNFTLVGVQELDIRDNIVDELITNNWTTTITEYSTNTTIDYSLNHLIYQNMINASIIFTNQSSTYVYGGVSHNLPSNSLKITVLISSWIYKSSLNRLRVVFKTNLENSVDGCGNELPSLLFDGSNQGLKYLKVQKNGIVFFGSFSDIVVVDSRPVYTVNQVLNQTEPDSNGQSSINIGVVLPQCQLCLIDPDFSALIDTKSKDGSQECGVTKSSDGKWRIIVGAVVGGVGFVAIAVTSAFLYKRLSKEKKENVKLQKKLDRMSTDQSKI